jgi:hypothetical protein
MRAKDCTDYTGGLKGNTKLSDRLRLGKSSYFKIKDFQIQIVPSRTDHTIEAIVGLSVDSPKFSFQDGVGGRAKLIEV